MKGTFLTSYPPFFICLAILLLTVRDIWKIISTAAPTIGRFQLFKLSFECDWGTSSCYSEHSQLYSLISWQGNIIIANGLCRPRVPKSMPDLFAFRMYKNKKCSNLMIKMNRLYVGTKMYFCPCFNVIFHGS